MTRKQNLFTSKTAVGVYAVLLGAIAPILMNISSQSRLPTSGEMSQMLMMMALSTLPLMGRYAATDTTYTPAGFPGRNESDVSDVPIGSPAITPEV